MKACAVVILVAFFSSASVSRGAPKPVTLDARPLAGKTVPLTPTVTEVALATGRVAAAQTGVPAAIYRSTGCGFEGWIGGMPTWYDQLILFNEDGLGASLTRISVPVCFDWCHVAGRCPGQGGAEDCDCLAPEDLPFDATFQLYDGDPCGSGVQIAGAGGSVPITPEMIPDAQIGDGASNCFDLSLAIQPAVAIPHEVWIEASFGHDDSAPLTGQAKFPNESPLSGLDDGVDCVTFCDRGADAGCVNDPDGCDWFMTELDSKAEIVFTLQPVPPPAETKWPGVSTYTVEGNEAILPNGGDRVFFDVMVSDFDPGGVNGTQVRTFQTQIDASGYPSGWQGTLAPASVPCTEHADCEPQMGTGSLCDEFVLNSHCQPAYVNLNRSDHLFFGLTANTACDLSNPDYRCAAVVIIGSAGSPGRDSYLSTLVLDVPANARGTFTIDLKEPLDTHLSDPGNELLPRIGVVPGKVTVPAGRCCYDLDAVTPSCADLVTPDDCAALPGPNTFLLNGVCDETCAQCQPSSQAQTEMQSFDVVARNRYLSVEAGDPGRLQAIRVTAVSLPPPYDVWNGQQWFAGEPKQVCENSGQGAEVPIAECGPSPGLNPNWLWAVPLVCDESQAHYMDWSTLGMVHLLHEGIVPSRMALGGGSIAIPASYDVQLVDRPCDAGSEAAYSDPLTLTQGAWGDLVQRCDVCPCKRPDNSVDIITDAVAIVQKFSNSSCSLSIARSDLDPTIPDFRIDVTDTIRVNEAFRGIHYPFSPADPGDPCR